jgi:uncharacterized protein YndB with AHSA1/START domain
VTGATTRELTIRRVFDAPRELVWRAWTEPAQLSRWWGRRGWSTPLETIVMDVRPGGAFRLRSVSDADGEEMTLESVYREVVEPERLVWGEDGAAAASVTFTDLGDGRTEMVFHTTMHATGELCDRARNGLGSAFERLAEILDDHDHDHTTIKEQR